MHRSPSHLALLDDHLLAHEFIRRYGRRPTAAELTAFRRRCDDALARHGNVRVTLARLISRQ